MFNEILTIAEGTWRRILRMREVYFLIASVLIIIGNMANYDILMMGEHQMLMIDVSLVLNSIAAVLTAISITFEIHKELREGVVSTLLAKPLGRTRYLVGKIVGISVTGFIITGIIMLGFIFIYWLSFGEKVMPSMIQGHVLIMASMIPMAALAVFFAVTFNEGFSALLTVIAIWICFSTANITGAKYLYGGILPDLNFFNLKSAAVYDVSIHWYYILLCIVWGVAYSFFITSISSLIFQYRDLK